MSTAATRMVCSACGAEVDSVDEFPFRCPNWRDGDDVDHVLTKQLSTDEIRFRDEAQDNPFWRYRELFHSYQLASAHGFSDSEWLDLVAELDDALHSVDGTRFRTTPFARDDALSEELGFDSNGGVWVKDESGNVSGSHKSRHLFGIALYLKAFERLGFVAGGGEHTFAIASCGNAALAAAVIARALENPLEVFIPTDADPKIVSRLASLGARITTCPRREGETGDPCFARYRERVREGALPFTVQGPENGLVIEGGSTLAYEIAESSQREGTSFDRVFVQVGGGALASATIQGFDEAKRLGVGASIPIVAVQTMASPLALAHERLLPEYERSAADSLALAAQHRSRFMQPLSEAPSSLAYGILDDETYDWRAILTASLRDKMPTVQCTEERLEEAWKLANRNRDVPVCATGSAGLAGLMELRAQGIVGSQERVVVLFTGAQR